MEESVRITDNDKLMEYLWLGHPQTNLNVDIFVDDSNAFERYGHSLVLYLRNGYSRDVADFIPILVSNKPKVMDDDMDFHISNDDIISVMDFIQENQKLLVLLAKGEIDTCDFVYKLKRRIYKEEFYMQDEIIEITPINNKEVHSSKRITSGGVYYDANTNTFSFNFGHDHDSDIIKLENIAYSVDKFERCYHYGYKFAEDIDNNVRFEFIKQVKSPESFEDEKDLNLFISKAVGYLDSQISLPQYNVVVYPQSLSELNRKMLSYLSRITSVKYIEIEMVKDLPMKIEFDYERFRIEVLESKENGQPKYMGSQKDEVIANIKAIMDHIHKSDYLSLARDIKEDKYRQYMKNFSKFNDEESKITFEHLIKSNVIVLDDNGTSIHHLLNTLRTINDTNKIVIYSLIGK